MIDPFHGHLFYDPGGEHGRCAAPPYDVIDPAERERYATLSPANVVHLTLPQPDTASGLEPCSAARNRLAAMIADGRLVRDDQPSFYLQDVCFPDPHSPGGVRTRRGLLGAVSIDGPGAQEVRRHEAVLEATLTDRLQLMRATRANLEPIFLLYSDRSGRVDELLDPVRQQPPMRSARLEDFVYELRRTGSDVTKAVARLLRDRPLYIADGHHRFAVAQRYRREQPELPGAGHRLALLVRAEDPGVLVLPTHRIVRELDPSREAVLLQRLKQFFTLEPVPREQISTALEHAVPTGTFAVRLRDRAFLATPTDTALHAMEALGSTEEPLRSLDVSLLHALVLDPEAPGPSVTCEYVKGTCDLSEAVLEDHVPLTFFLTPPAVETILRVSDQGLVMPSKSTYFFPKAASGQVLLRLDEEL